METFELSRGQRFEMFFYRLGLHWLRWRRPERLRFEAQRRAGKGDLVAYLAAVEFTGADDQPWAAHALEACWSRDGYEIYGWLWENHTAALQQEAVSVIFGLERSNFSGCARQLVTSLPAGPEGLWLVDVLMPWCVMGDHCWLAKQLLERVPLPTEEYWLTWCHYAIFFNKYELLMRLLKWGRHRINNWAYLKNQALAGKRLEIFELLEILEQGRSDLGQMYNIEDLRPMALVA